MPIPRRLDHAAIYCSDIDNSVEWYGRVLGLTLAYQGPIGAFFDVGDTILGLRPAHHRLEALFEQHLAFAVDDLAAARRDVLRHDVRLLEEGVITEGYILGQRFFDIAGPDGEDIELVERSRITVNPHTLHGERASGAVS